MCFTVLISGLCSSRPSGRIANVLLEFVVVWISIYTPVFSQQATYEHEGHVCLSCAPGEYLKNHCITNYEKSACESCPSQTFQSHFNQAPRCGACILECLHDKNMEIVRECTSTHNTVCECKAGYYRHIAGNGHANVHTCVKYTPCQYGQILTKEGTKHADQECSFCQEQFYYKDDSCEPCSECKGINSTILQLCSHTSDTVCRAASINDTVQDSGRSAEWRPSLVEIILLTIASCILGLILIYCFVKRLRKQRQTEQKPNDGTSGVPLLLVPPPPTPAEMTTVITPGEVKPTTLRQRSRTLSETSTISESTRIYFLELKDPSTWTRQVFGLLCKHLANNWKMFVRSLPGDSEYASTIDNRCDQICQEVRDNVPEQIHQALREWKNSHAWPTLSVESVLCCLESIGNCEALREKTWNLANKLAEKQAKLKTDS